MFFKAERNYLNRLLVEHIETDAVAEIVRVGSEEHFSI